MKKYIEIDRMKIDEKADQWLLHNYFKLCLVMASNNAERSEIMPKKIGLQQLSYMFLT